MNSAAQSISIAKELSKILVVDDRKDNLIAMRVALGNSGYELYEALSGEEAIELAKVHDFAVILLDVQMPNLDGYGTAKILRSSRRTKATPIIFVTAIHRGEEYERLGYVAGAVDYLFKPINVDILKAKVSVFVELQQMTFENARQAELLRRASVREKENQLLREALIARDEFLSIASHELKTPLTPLCLQMQTFIELYKNNAEGEVPRERLVKMLTTSAEQIDRLTRLINELVDVSRLRNGNLELDREDSDLSSLVLRVLESFEEQISASGCKLSMKLDEGIVGYWDTFRVEQIFINLLTNALKYGAEKPIEVSVTRDGTDALLCVHDNGIGIQKEDQDRIFQRFERAVSSRNYGGLGLGLYIAWQMARMHNGSISVASEPGRGATFMVRLPLTN